MHSTQLLAILREYCIKKQETGCVDSATGLLYFNGAA